VQVPGKKETEGHAGRDLLGHTIGSLGVRSKTGASILAVVRGDEVIPNPGADLAFEAGDAVGVLGTPEQRAAFRAIAKADDSPEVARETTDR
jgi:TrkA domain protein